MNDQWYTTSQDRVTEFHRVFRQRVSDVPELIPEIFGLRKRLIDEERQEFYDELDAMDLVKAAKELADLLYVVYGTAVSFGIDLDAVLAEVHESNMTKLDDHGNPIFQDDGKVLKGPNYREADVAKVLGVKPNPAKTPTQISTGEQSGGAGQTTNAP